MKRLLIALSFVCVLGFAGGASAAGVKEPVYPPEPGGASCWAQLPDGELWYPCGSEDLFTVNCVRLMEKNMRRIDAYLPIVKSGAQLTPDELAKYERALALWNQVKHDCWKEFSYERDKHLH